MSSKLIQFALHLKFSRKLFVGLSPIAIDSTCLNKPHTSVFPLFCLIFQLPAEALANSKVFV